jgi:hypothetical protein
MILNRFRGARARSRLELDRDVLAFLKIYDEFV